VALDRHPARWPHCVAWFVWCWKHTGEPPVPIPKRNAKPLGEVPEKKGPTRIRKRRAPRQLEKKIVRIFVVLVTPGSGTAWSCFIRPMQGMLCDSQPV
jgi:hypothetical protein